VIKRITVDIDCNLQYLERNAIFKMACLSTLHNITYLFYHGMYFAID